MSDEQKIDRMIQSARVADDNWFTRHPGLAAVLLVGVPIVLCMILLWVVL